MTEVPRRARAARAVLLECPNLGVHSLSCETPVKPA